MIREALCVECAIEIVFPGCIFLSHISHVVWLIIRARCPHVCVVIGYQHSRHLFSVVTCPAAASLFDYIENLGGRDISTAIVSTIGKAVVRSLHLFACFDSREWLFPMRTSTRFRRAVMLGDHIKVCVMWDRCAWESSRLAYESGNKLVETVGVSYYYGHYYLEVAEF